MNITITARHFELTPAVESYARGKFEKVWKHFEILSAQLRLSAGEGGTKSASADIRIKGKDVHIEEREEDLYAAIDKLASASHLALSKAKEKRSARPA